MIFRLIFDFDLYISIFTDSTKVKLDIMNEIVPKPNGDINDFVPLLNTTIPCLNLINEAAKKDLDIPGGHRLYFISDKLKVNNSFFNYCKFSYDSFLFFLFFTDKS